jgi:predicted polyphosphate/ATP-dependent NAD kinase
VSGGRLGLIVNPIAGMGGRVGLKGTDGASTLARAVELGAQEVAGSRAEAGLRLLSAMAGPDLEILTVGGPMGANLARSLDLRHRVVLDVASAMTTAADTRAAAARMQELGADLLLFVGGDGTARDVCEAVGTAMPVIGLPAGVKMHSAVFATGPRAAAEVATAIQRRPDRAACQEREVMDVDEDAARGGERVVRLFGTLLVPTARGLVQGLKSLGAPDEGTQVAGLAEAVARRLVPGELAVLGPGTTLRAIANRLGVEKTLLGVDVIEIAGKGMGRTIEADASEDRLLAAVRGRSAVVVVSPIGGQGFVLGRGNQQLSPTVLRTIGLDRLIVAATPAKLAALGGRPLLIDTGDPDLDRVLAGHRRVVTGLATESVVRLEAV